MYVEVQITLPHEAAGQGEWIDESYAIREERRVRIEIGREKKEVSWK